MLGTIGKVAAAPFNQFGNSFGHWLGDEKESLPKRISDKATVVFGLMIASSAVGAVVSGLRYGVEAGVDFIASTIFQTPSTPSFGATLALDAWQWSLVALAVGISLFAVSVLLRYVLHSSKSKAVS